MNCSAGLGAQLSLDGARASPQPAPVLQPVWDAVRAQEALLRSPLFPALFSFAAYCGCCLPFAALDVLSGRWRALRAYRLQPATPAPSPRLLGQCLLRSVLHHVCCVLPATLARWSWTPLRLPAAAPSLPRLLLEAALCLLLFDALYFLWHLLHHRVPRLYRAFHRRHHRHVATFALTTQDSSAWELLWLGLLASLPPALLRCHPLTELAFHLANIWLSVEDHSGYDLPWATHRLVPFGLYGGAPHHDLHHRRARANFAPYFTHWDRLFGTLQTAGPAKPRH